MTKFVMKSQGFLSRCCLSILSFCISSQKDFFFDVDNYNDRDAF